MTVLSFDRPDTGSDGVALWRRIADDLRLDITGGALPIGSRLPGEVALAERFGVNRHTVRAALKTLGRDGLTQARQGQGTFVVGSAGTSIGIPNGERFATGIAGPSSEVGGELLESAVEAVSAAVAAALWLPADELVTRMATLSRRNGQPVSVTTTWFSAERFPAIDAVYRELGSILLALRHYDAADCVRATTRLSARRVDIADAKVLDLAPGGIVMVAEGVDAMPDGQPIAYSLSRFVAERVELVLLGE
jgi:GntR family phosphonate transport system transcriptional regulator